MTIDLGQNLDDIETKEDYGVMEIGDYFAFVSDAEEKLSQNGNQMIELTFKLAGNPKYDGKLFWEYLVFGLEHSLEKLKRTMTCLGMDTSNVSKVSAEQFVGKTCRIRNKHEEYMGETKDKIYYLKPRESSSAPDASDGDPGPQEPVPISDDDSIPF